MCRCDYIRESEALRLTPMGSPKRPQRDIRQNARSDPKRLRTVCERMPLGFPLDEWGRARGPDLTNIPARSSSSGSV